MAGKDLKPVIGEFLFHPFFKRCGSNDVFIMREATGIESIFPDWIYRCKLDQDYYQPFDLVFYTISLHFIHLSFF